MTENTNCAELLRSKIFRINKKQKNRIVLFLLTFFQERGTKFEKIYLGGSHSRFSKKFPNQDSDIDIYVFFDFDSIIKYQDFISDIITMSLGMKINIYFVKKEYIKSVSEGMEVLK